MKTSKLLEALGFGMHLRDLLQKGYNQAKKISPPCFPVPLVPLVNLVS